MISSPTLTGRVDLTVNTRPGHTMVYQQWSRLSTIFTREIVDNHGNTAVVQQTHGGVDGGGEPHLLHGVLLRVLQLSHGVGVADQLDDMTEYKSSNVMEAVIRDHLPRLGRLDVNHR